MGNVCSGNNPEAQKATAFQTTDESGVLTDNDGNQRSALAPASDVILSDHQHPDADSGLSSQQQQLQQSGNQVQLLALREEQKRLDLIVQMAGRGMVSVRSTRGSTGYYDQGFAAALGQHLEQTTKFPDQLPMRLPPATKPTNNTIAATPTGNNSTVYQRLSQAQWENIALGKKGTGLAGCGGENPNTYMDHVAVSFLDSVVPKKERLFHDGVGPMVENLL